MAKFCIISNRAEFFQQASNLCKRMSAGNSVEHISCEMWSRCDKMQPVPKCYLIADPLSGIPEFIGQISANAFAGVATVCQNSEEQNCWVSVSHGEFVLWLRDVSPLSDETSIVEEVLVQSRHLRLSELRVPTACRLIPKLRERLMRSFRDYPVVESTRENHFCLALEEALNNAFYHGNLEISSELKEGGSSRFVEMAAERELLSPWQKRHVYVTELVSVFGVWLTIQDDGQGFDFKAALKRCDDPESLLASGRGLLMMRAFSDELIFSPAGNQVTLVLYADSLNRELDLRSFSLLGKERQKVIA